MKNQVLATVPARGGSKGIPRKNVRLLAGKPLIAHTIEQALLVDSISRIVVSTDDTEIAEVARSYNVEVIPRPAELCDDIIMPDAALLHVLDHLKENEHYEPDLIVFLQPTSPMRRPEDIEKAIHKLLLEGADSLFSGCISHGFVWRDQDGMVFPLNYDYRNRPRRQDAPKDYIENGSIYIFKPWVIRENGTRLGGKIAIYEMDVIDSFQIDEPEDFLLVEQLLTYQQRQGIVY